MREKETYLDDNDKRVREFILERETPGEEETDKRDRSLERGVQKPDNVERREGADRLLTRKGGLWVSHLDTISTREDDGGKRMRTRGSARK